MPTCDRCRLDLLEDANYCPRCGDAVTAADIAGPGSPDGDGMSMAFRLELGEDPAPGKGRSIGFRKSGSIGCALAFLAPAAAIAIAAIL